MKPADQNPFRPGAWIANYTCFMPLWNSQYLKIHVNIQSLLHDMIHDYLQNYICTETSVSERTLTESEKKPKIVHYFQMKLYGRYFNM